MPFLKRKHPAIRSMTGCLFYKVERQNDGPLDVESTPAASDVKRILYNLSCSIYAEGYTKPGDLH